VHCLDDQVVGHVAVVVRTIWCGTTRVEIAGIQNLAVAPVMRGRGLASALMSESMDEARRRGIRFGLLFCTPDLGRFYAPLGWVRTDADISMLDEDGRSVPIPDKNIGMFLELTGESLPPGDIDLCGRDW
jgi:predicted acetyltransferase